MPVLSKAFLHIQPITDFRLIFNVNLTCQVNISFITLYTCKIIFWFVTYIYLTFTANITYYAKNDTLCYMIIFSYFLILLFFLYYLFNYPDYIYVIFIVIVDLILSSKLVMVGEGTWSILLGSQRKLDCTVYIKGTLAFFIY